MAQPFLLTLPNNVPPSYALCILYTSFALGKHTYTYCLSFNTRSTKGYDYDYFWVNYVFLVPQVLNDFGFRPPFKG